MQVSEGTRTSKAISTVQVVIVLAVIVFAGVAVYFYGLNPGGSTTSGTTGTTSAVQYKDTIVIGTTDSLECACIDPARAYDYFGGSWLPVNLGSPLVDFAPGATDTSPSSMQPALATKWVASTDGMTYTIILRAGLRFDDGHPFNSTAVKYSIDRGISLSDPDGPFVGVGVGAIIDHIDTPNSTAVVFHLKAPFAPFLAMLTFQAMYPVDPWRVPVDKIVNFTAGNAQAGNPFGLGPYKLTEWTRQGNSEQEMKFDVNPNYWNYPAYPKTPHMIIRFYTDATALAAAVRAGDVDFAYRQFTSSDLASLQTTAGLRVYSSPGAFIQYLVLNQQIAPMNNTGVRQAIAAAVNRTDLVNTVFLGTASPLYSQVPKGMAYHEDAFKTAYAPANGDANIVKATELLATAGYSATNKLTVDLWYENSGHYPQSSDQAVVLKRGLEKTGVITVNLHGTDWGSYRTNRRAGNMEMFIMGWYPDFIDPFDYTQPFFQASGSSWLNDAYNSTQMNSLISQAIGATTQSQAASLYQQIQTLSATDVPMVPLYQGGANCCGVVAKTTVGGIYLDVTLVFRMYTITETVS